MSVAVDAASAQPPITGREFEKRLGPIIFEQAIPTEFGDSIGQVSPQAPGSEIDNLRYSWDGGTLTLGFGGNLQSNFNKFCVFIDFKPGGQNRLRGDNPDVSFDGLNRMGDDGSGNGIRFDAGVEPDLFLTYTLGGSPTPGFAHFLDAAELLAGGGGAGALVGGGDYDDGPIEGSFLGGDVRANIDNSNFAGVRPPGQPNFSAPALVDTGVEIAVDLGTLGWNGTDAVRVVAFVNGAGHDFVSNQLVGSLPTGTGNLGEPRAIDFQTIAGDQFVEIPAPVIVSADGSTGISTVQDGIAAAADTAEVIVLPGIYPEDTPTLTTAGKRIEVRSVDPLNPAVVEATRIGSWFFFNSGETSLTQIRGFLFENLPQTPMYFAASAPKVTDCVFRNNTGTLSPHGGGLWYDNPENARIERCRFDGNFTVGRGGGLYLRSGTAIVLDCVFINNTAGTDGGGIAVLGSLAPTSLTVVNSVFVNNLDGSTSGTAIDLIEPVDALVQNSIFYRNRDNILSARGGAIRVENATGSVQVRYSTFVDNQAPGLPEAIVAIGSSVSANGCIFVGNTPGVGTTYSLVDAAPSGTGVIAGDPMFVERFPALFDDIVAAFTPMAGSPLIDATLGASGGDPADLDRNGETNQRLPQDITGKPRYIDDLATPDVGGSPPLADMGAIEYTLPADYNGDGLEDPDDVRALERDVRARDPRADLNGDGAVDFLDVAELLRRF